MLHFPVLTRNIGVPPAIVAATILLAGLSIGLVASAAPPTLPGLLAGGALALLAPELARRIGPERSLLLPMLMLAVGGALRGVPGQAQFAGAIGIAAGSVIAAVLPAMARASFADRAPAALGVFVAAIATGIALSPASFAAGVPGALAAGLVAAQIRRTPKLRRARARFRGHWRDPAAWSVCVFAAVLPGFCMSALAWLPTLLHHRLSLPGAGMLVVPAALLTQVPAALIGPRLAARAPDQTLALALSALGAMLGLLLCVVLPTRFVWAAAIPLGLGQGGLLAIGMALFVLRAPNPAATAALSGMAMAAACGGAALVCALAGSGVPRHVAVTILAALGIAIAGSGALAGLPRLIAPAPDPTMKRMIALPGAARRS